MLMAVCMRACVYVGPKVGNLAILSMFEEGLIAQKLSSHLNRRSIVMMLLIEE